MSIYSIYLDHFLYSCLYFKRLSELCSFETYMFSIQIHAWNLSSYFARAFTFSRLRYFWYVCSYQCLNCCCFFFFFKRYLLCFFLYNHSMLEDVKCKFLAAGKLKWPKICVWISRFLALKYPQLVYDVIPFLFNSQTTHSLIFLGQFFLV